MDDTEFHRSFKGSKRVKLIDFRNLDSGFVEE